MTPTATNRLLRARELAGLSLGQAAKLLGWAQGPLHAMELGDGAPPTEAELGRLSRLYGCSIEYLRGDPLLPPPADLIAALDAKGIEGRDRAAVIEFAQLLGGRQPQPNARERLAEVAERKADEPMPSRAAKVRYVQSQGQTRAHHCHWPGCDKQVPPAMWGCRAHWFALPKALRDRIWAAYRPGQEATMTPSAEYLQVADDVQRWIRENATAAASGRKTTTR